ncbi:hypothetical protein PCE1_003764 [Barthelona sp. PCE]
MSSSGQGTPFSGRERVFDPGMVHSGRYASRYEGFLAFRTPDAIHIFERVDGGSYAAVHTHAAPQDALFCIAENGTFAVAASRSLSIGTVSAASVVARDDLGDGELEALCISDEGAVSVVTAGRFRIVQLMGHGAETTADVALEDGVLWAGFSRDSKDVFLVCRSNVSRVRDGLVLRGQALPYGVRSEHLQVHGDADFKSLVMIDPVEGYALCLRGRFELGGEFRRVSRDCLSVYVARDGFIHEVSIRQLKPVNSSLGTEACGSACRL